MCLWVTTAFAACSVRTRVHYVDAEERSREHDQYIVPTRFQSRASSMFSPSLQSPASATGFPYRFVFPANHPAINQPVFSQYLQNPTHQPEHLYSAEDIYTLPAAKQHQLFPDYKHYQQQKKQHQQHQQQQPQQQLNFESVGQVQHDFLGGGEGGGKQHVSQPQPYHVIKQPKHYQSYELATSVAAPVHQLPYQSVATAASVAQPIMLLIPSSGQPGAPYQTLVLVPSSTAASAPPASVFSGFHPQFQQLQTLPTQFLPGFVTHSRGSPVQVTGFPSGIGGNGGAGLGKFPGAQLFHRSHDPLQPQQQLHRQPHKTLPTSYQGSGSTHVSHSTATGADTQQPLEDKVGHGTEASGENSDERVGGNSAETKHEEKTPLQPPSSDFGDKTSTKLPKRIVVT